MYKDSRIKEQIQLKTLPLQNDGRKLFSIESDHDESDKDPDVTISSGEEEDAEREEAEAEEENEEGDEKDDSIDSSGEH